MFLKQIWILTFLFVSLSTAYAGKEGEQRNESQGKDAIVKKIANRIQKAGDTSLEWPGWPEESEWIEDKVAFLWFPAGKGFSELDFTRIDLEVNGEIWNSKTKFQNHGQLQSLDRAERPYFRFNIRVTREELNKLQAFLKKNKDLKRMHTTCVNGACEALREAGVLDVPLPASQVPFLASTYFKVLQKVGHSRIVSIEAKNHPDLWKEINPNSYEESSKLFNEVLGTSVVGTVVAIMAAFVGYQLICKLGFLWVAF